jgi:hypothetical protein
MLGNGNSVDIYKDIYNKNEINFSFKYVIMAKYIILHCFILLFMLGNGNSVDIYLEIMRSIKILIKDIQT